MKSISTGKGSSGSTPTMPTTASSPSRATAKKPEDLLIVILNATPVVREGYRIGVPQPGFYSEILNTDAATYGGSNVGNLGGQNASNQPSQGRAQSLCLTLPPLAAVFLKWQPS